MEARISALASRWSAVEAKITKLSQSVAVSPSVAAVGPPSSLDPCSQDTPEVARLRELCRTSLCMYSAVFQWVPSHYYEKSLGWRRDTLLAPSIRHLCKSILLENTHCEFEDCARRENARFYIIVFQYVERFDSDKLMRFIRDLNPGVGKKKFNFRLADPEVSAKLTGFGYNAVAPFGGSVDIPIVLSERIMQLTPGYFWMGGGHVDCKLRVDVDEFCSVLKPLVADITNPLSEEELRPLMAE